MNASETQLRRHELFFYTVLADAAYEISIYKMQESIDNRLGFRFATVLERKVIKSFLWAQGETHIALVRDNTGHGHVVFDGSNDIGNWIGNLLIQPLHGMIFEYDITDDQAKAVKKCVEDWLSTHWNLNIASFVGHSRGGMYASQFMDITGKDGHSSSIRSRYSGACAVTFNGLKPKPSNNGVLQFHFLMQNEHSVSLISPRRRYIKVEGGNRSHLSISSNHGMKYFLEIFTELN